MKIDICCNDDKCPICESKLQYKNKTYPFEDKFCINGCYAIKQYWEMLYEIYIFNEHYFKISNDIENQDEIIKEIEKLIAYWRENDRYLAKILREV